MTAVCQQGGSCTKFFFNQFSAPRFVLFVGKKAELVCFICFIAWGGGSFAASMLKIMNTIKCLLPLVLFIVPVLGYGQPQTTGESFSLEQCIGYALEHNLGVQQSSLNADINKVSLGQLRTSRFPSVSASVRQNLSWSDVQSATSGDWNYEGNAVTTAGVNASLNLFNGLRITQSILQAETDYQAGLLDAEAHRESVVLQVLGAYTQVLYSAEQLENASRQVKVSQSQLALAGERMEIGAISKADYMQVEAQLAAEELTLTNAQNQLATNRVTLMQLMEYPISDGFDVVRPDLSQVQPPLQMPVAAEVFATARNVKPEVKSAALKLKSTESGISIARSAALPSLALDAGLTTNYTDKVQQLSFGSQLDHNLSPSLGLTLSVPIFSQGQVKASVATATIRNEIARLDEQSTLNTLRKNIEKATLDVAASSSAFVSATRQYSSAKASFEQAEERFARGVINTVDFLVQKTNLISAESSVLQARYNLVYSLKVLDFYTGNPITL